MSLILNILWILLGGWLLALGWLFAAALMAITLIGLPWARACLAISRYALWPFGMDTIDRALLTGEKDIGTSGFGVIGNIIWFALAGFWLALGHAIVAALEALTIIGIPLAVAHLKLANLSLAPIGKAIVTKEIAEELRRAAARETINSLNSSPKQAKLPILVAAGAVLAIGIAYSQFTGTKHPEPGTAATAVPVAPTIMTAPAVHPVVPVSTPDPAPARPKTVDVVTGNATVINTASLAVEGRTVPLVGLIGLYGEYRDQLQDFIRLQGGHVSCTEVDLTYDCKTVNGVNISEAAVLNGAAKVAPDASQRLVSLEQQARENQRGVWKH